MAAPPPGAAGGAEHEAGNGVFRELLKKRRADAGAILQSVRDYRDCPEVTRKQAELLLEHRFFRYVYQTGYPEWRAVMDALKETRYGMRRTGC